MCSGPSYVWQVGRIDPLQLSRPRGSMGAAAVKSKQSNESVRYTDEGITVVALDRKGRGLHRARPEQPSTTRWSPSLPERGRLLPAAVLLLLVAGLLVAWLAS